MFTLKGSESLQVEIKGARGLVGDAYGLRPGRFEMLVPLFIAGYTSLRAGEETEVLAAVSDLPANADVKSIVARLEVADDDPAPAPPASGVTIKRDDETPIRVEMTPSIPTRPRNVTIRLEQGGPIWTFNDMLVKDSYELPDFAEQLNAYLDKVSAVQGGALKFLVKSDTPGKVRIVITSKNVTRLQTQTWTNDLDQTVRLDRNLDLGFGERSEIPLDAIAAPGRRLTGLRMDVVGTFGPDRLLGSVREHAGNAYATVSGDYAIAQQLVLDIDVQASGISGFLGADAETELYVELQADQNGLPGGDAPLARSNVTIPPDDEDAGSWVYAQFDTPAPLKAETPYWIVVKGVRGKARLGIEAAGDTYLGAVVVNRTGRLWKPFGPATKPANVSMLRVVYAPGIDNQSAAVQIGVRGAGVQAVDPQQTPKTIALALGNASLTQAVIEITSYGRGALTVANVIQEY